MDDKKHSNRNNNKIAIINEPNKKLILGLFTKEELEYDLSRMRDGEDLAKVNEKYSSLRISEEHQEEITDSPNADNNELLKILQERASLSFLEIVDLIKERVSFFGIYDSNERLDISEVK